MSILVEYDEDEDPPQWFKMRNIKYCLRESVVINGEGSEVYYALISEIKRTNEIQVQWYYLPHEMVMSNREKASVHPNEIFITESTDWLDVETIQMKAAIFHTKGIAAPKKIPDQWMILRRKYDPYKNTIKSVDLVKDKLDRVDKLNISLCSRSSDSDCGPVIKRQSSSIINNSRQKKTSLDPAIEVKFGSMIFSSSDDNQKHDKRKVATENVSSKDVSLDLKNGSSKSSYFFLSSEDNPPATKPVNTTTTPKRSYEIRKPKSKTDPKSFALTKNKPKIGTSKSSSSTTNTRVTRTSRLTSELQTLSLAPKTPTTSRKTRTPRATTVKQDIEETNTTRSGRKIKPVQSFRSLQQSLAIEALLKANLVKPKSDESEQSDDSEVSIKENKAPKNALTNTPKTERNIKAAKRKTKKKHRKYSSSDESDSNDEHYQVKRKKRTNKRLRTPLAPKQLKPATVNTPCVIPMRAKGQSRETCYSLARSRLHVSAVPESLPCREEQFADIYYFLEGKLEEKSGGCMYISGVPGTGKTATVRDVLKHIDDGDHSYQMIEINGMKLSDPKQLYSLIYRHLEGRKVTPDHGNLLLSEYFGKNEKKSIVLVVDELDLLWTRKQHVMYNLFDWPNRANSKLVVIAIANTMDLPERMLMNKVASRLGLTRMTFQPYSHKQLLEIINSRLEGTTAFAPEACMLAARKVAAASGDARRALDICRHAIDIAEQSGAELVTSTHIQRAITDMYQSVKTKAIMNCTLYQKVFLKSVLGVFRRKGVEEAVFKEVYEVFSSLCQFQGLFSPPCSAMLQLCLELGGSRILLIEQGPPSLHTHIRLNCSQDDVVFALKESPT